MHKSLYVNGQWLSGESEEFTSYNPATNEVLWQGLSASDKQIENAVMSARLAQRAWENLSLNERYELLAKVNSEIENEKDNIAITIAKENGKPLWEAKAEVSAMLAKLKHTIASFNLRCPENKSEIKGAESVLRHRAHGVLAIFGPFNFPGHLPLGHIYPALLAGNTVVFKPSELTPLVAEILIKAFAKVNLPKGVINLVQGGAKVGINLSNNKDLNGILFTGSNRVGANLHKNYGGDTSKMLALEMGGNNPLVVYEADDYEAAAYFTIQSAYITSGQRCTCARRLIISDDANGEQFLQQLKTWVQGIVIGKYDANPEPFMGPLVSKDAAMNVINKQKQLIAMGAKSLIASEILEQGEAFITPGLIDITGIKDLKDEEVFGPLLQVIRVKNFDEAIMQANNTEYGLSAGLISNNLELYERFLKEVRAGLINWNRPITGAVGNQPFGGVGKSGNHRPSAFYAADYCVYPQASIETSVLELPEALTPGLNL